MDKIHPLSSHRQTSGGAEQHDGTKARGGAGGGAKKISELLGVEMPKEDER